MGHIQLNSNKKISSITLKQVLFMNMVFVFTLCLSLSAQSDIGVPPILPFGLMLVKDKIDTDNPQFQSQIAKWGDPKTKWQREQLQKKTIKYINAHAPEIIKGINSNAIPTDALTPQGIPLLEAAMLSNNAELTETLLNKGAAQQKTLADTNPHINNNQNSNIAQ